MNAQLPIKRATIDEIVGLRNLAIQKFLDATDAMDEALHTAARAAGGTGFYVGREIAEKLFSSYDRGHEDFLATMRKKTDQAIWGNLINGYGFNKLMDRQAMEEFRKTLDKDPPEVTVETAEATMAQLMIDADALFRRGIANAFSALDRRFKSHDGFKIGDRIVLTYVFNDYNSWADHRKEDTIKDIERVFLTLDGKAEDVPEDRFNGILGLINTERLRISSLTRSSWQVEDDYFRVKAFKNGNLHMWFKRDDLLVEVNKLLAEYYGEVLGAGHGVAEEKFEPRRDIAKNFGFYPTPDKLALSIIPDAYELRGKTVLEPSAGTGSLSKLCVEREAIVTCVEYQGNLATQLDDAGIYSSVWCSDFLDMEVSDLGLFDFVIMNPPFDMQRDIDHVTHAWKFVKPGGRLISIMSAGVAFRTDRKSEAFRAFAEANGNDYGGPIRDLPAGSFSESGTNVNTCVVNLRKPN